ncbi:hypothetical protein IGI04_039759 [Brassica rapa subsp. trilocularis]|uniref:Uncharacterized protein n=1 Tax=Brassica rapa subsp. trilocularis TaxID=1813537 RepID=A0ABQ7KQ65_BRACM|nr:hypothetical protein IGI04_039759 [Brassica rapa subsp. trilocularis]
MSNHRVPLLRVVVGQESELKGSLLGVNAVQVSSSSSPNPIQTLTADIIDLMNKNHVFRWFHEAFKYEMQQLDYQVRLLEEELQLLKATMRTEGTNNGRIVVGCCLIHVVIVLGIRYYM